MTRADKQVEYSILSVTRNKKKITAMAILSNHQKKPNIKGDLSKFLAILLLPFGYIAPKTCNYLAFQSFDFEPTDESYPRNAS